jgi:putative SOS response-associated peptidase YedK
MCTLYANTKSRELIRALFRISPNRAAAFEPRNAILPSATAPVIRLADDGERELTNMSWGFVRREPSRAPRRVVNTRDDQVRSNPFWRTSFEARRCLVPATSYAEPQGVKPATWHWFAITDSQDDRPLFAFPGVWRRYEGPLKKDGPAVAIDVYSILTSWCQRRSPAKRTARLRRPQPAHSEISSWVVLHFAFLSLENLPPIIPFQGRTPDFREDRARIDENRL